PMLPLMSGKSRSLPSSKIRCVNLNGVLPAVPPLRLSSIRYSAEFQFQTSSGDRLCRRQCVWISRLSKRADDTRTNDGRTPNVESDIRCKNTTCTPHHRG